MTESTPTPDPKAITRTARDPAATAEQLQACAGQGDAIDRLLAKHPNASTALLERPSHSSDKTAHKNLVLNASASKETLIRLALQFPAEFILPAKPDAKWAAKAAKSKDWLARSAAILSSAAPPSLLQLLGDDPVGIVRKLAIRRLRAVDVQGLKP